MVFNVYDGGLFYLYQFYLYLSMGGHHVMNNPLVHFYDATKFSVRALAEGVHNELREAKSKIRIMVSLV